IRSADKHFIGVAEPERGGKITIFDLRTRQPVLSTQIDPEDLAKADRLQLLHDPERFYVALASGDVAANVVGRPLIGMAAFPAVPVHGAVYAFDHASGR